MSSFQGLRRINLISAYWAMGLLLFAPFVHAQNGGPENFVPPANMDADVGGTVVYPNSRGAPSNQTQAPPRNMGVPLPENQTSDTTPGDAWSNQGTPDPGTLPLAPRPVLRPFNFDNPTLRYDATMKRDIFYFRSLTDLYRKNEPIPLVVTPPGVAPVIPREMSEDPLQNADLTSFEVLGILWEVAKPRAIIKDAKGQIHTIYKGTKIGIKGGSVAAIREGEIVVIEYWEEDDKIVKKPRMMVIKDRVR